MEERELGDAAWACGSNLDEAAWRAVLDGSLRLKGAGWCADAHHVRWEGRPGGRALTPTESVVLAMVLSGLSNTRAAAELGIGASTATGHLRSVRSKLGANFAQLLSLGPIVARLSGGRAAGPPSMRVGRSGLLLSGESIARHPLTESERDVVERLVLGRSHREIADARGTSPRTVGDQLHKVYQKLEVDSSRQLVLRLHGVVCRPMGRAQALRLLRER